MNEKKLKRLLDSARAESAPAASADFAADVLRAVHREPASASAPFSMWEHMNGLFPRVAAVAVAVILLSVAADWSLSAAGVPDVGEGATQVMSQFLFNANVEDL